MLLSIGTLTNTFVLRVSAARNIPIKNGPFLDKVSLQLYRIDDAVEALINDKIDTIDDFVPDEYISPLESSENIKIVDVLRNGYGFFSINTQKNPLNYTSFRRACAFAFNKTLVSEQLWNGHSVPQDSCIPQINPFSCEGRLSYNYYDGNINLGNQILDDAGFEIDPISEHRLTPNGDPFNITIEVAQSSNVAIQAGVILESTLHSLNIDAVCYPTDMFEYLQRVYTANNSYDIVFLGTAFSNFDVDWLAYEFWSESAFEPEYNFPYWQNATYDSWRVQLLHATDYDDVYEAAFKMQEIWVHACPEIVCYENAYTSAYRTDHLTDFIFSPGEGPYNWWTLYKSHQKNDLWGGNLRVGVSSLVDTLNFMSSVSCYCDFYEDKLYDTLFRYDSQGRLIPWLVESYYLLTNADNPSVISGTTRFEIAIITNATWSDGTPLTAFDVAYSFNFYNDSSGNPYGFYSNKLTAAYALSNYTLRIEFSGESYWLTSILAERPILPEHVFEEIGPDNWMTWDPDPSEDGSVITSDPWYVSDYIAGENITLSRNEAYCYRFDETIRTSTTSTEPGIGTTTKTSPSSNRHTTPTTSPSSVNSIDWNALFPELLGPSITILSTIVIIIFGTRIVFERRKIPAASR